LEGNVSAPTVLYMRLKKRVHIHAGDTVTLGMTAKLLTDDSIADVLESLVLYHHQTSDGNRVVIDLLQMIRVIRSHFPNLTIETYGEPHVLLMVGEKAERPRMPVLIISWLLLFFGAGLAIMNFHTDVSMKEVHMRIAELVTGKHVEHPLWFQIPYSVGIGLGMLLFFNHLFKKRFNEEPNPLEVELYLYQENVNAYVVAEEMRKKQGGHGPSGPAGEPHA